MRRAGMKFTLLPVFCAAVLSCVTAASAQDHPPRVPDEHRLQNSIDRSFGKLRGWYFLPGYSLVSTQIYLGMGIPNPTRMLGDGNYLVSGFRWHSADEKAAVIASADRTMMAAGIIYYPCSKPPHNINCLKDRRRIVFVARKNDTPGLLQDMQDWADHEGAPYKDDPAGVGSVRKIVLPAREK